MFATTQNANNLVGFDFNATSTTTNNSSNNYNNVNLSLLTNTQINTNISNKQSVSL